MIRSRGSWCAPPGDLLGFGERPCAAATLHGRREDRLLRAFPPTHHGAALVCPAWWQARERAEIAVLREDVQRSDAAAEQALSMLERVRAEEAGLHARLSSAEAQLQRSAATLRAQEERLSDARRVGAAAAAHAVRSMAALEASAMRALQAADAKATAQLERLRTMQAKVEAAVNTGRSRRLNGRWSA
mmetsp:Transcript_4691/g.14174  ORF Transcript_4691/g.14174 Transcript_4691/m.14174 type:complete len:188 (-) Transcript_4691:691-1254(-)